MTAFITAKLGLGILSGATLVEPTAAEYARQPVTFTSFPSGTSTNDAAENFGVAVTNWGTLTAWGLFDAVGNQVMVGTLATSINGAAGQTVTVMQGAIALTFAPQATNPGTGLTLYGIFTACGTNQITATAITSLTAIIDSVPSGSGVILPAVAVGTTIYVKNQDPTNALQIYPNVGAQINSFGTNGPISVAPGVTLSLILTAADQWSA